MSDTPITDKFASPAIKFLPQAMVVHDSHARRLERDRAALMDALETADFYLREHGIRLPDLARAKLRAVLAAARANFPTESHE